MILFISVFHLQYFVLYFVLFLLGYFQSLSLSFHGPTHPLLTRQPFLPGAVMAFCISDISL